VSERHPVSGREQVVQNQPYRVSSHLRLQRFKSFISMSNQLLRRIKVIGESLCPPLLAPSIKRIIRTTPYARSRMRQGPLTQEPCGGRLLEEAWQHLTAANAAPRGVPGMPASPRWEALLARMRQEICFLGSELDAIHFAQSRLDFDHREPVEFSWQLYKLHEQTLAAQFPSFAAWFAQMSDSPFSRPDTLLRCGGRWISNVLFYHARVISGALAHVPKVDVVCEIGGGYGAPARLWLTNTIRRPRTYVIIDFPESLFFSEVFLRKNMPDLAVHYVSDAKGKLPDSSAQQTVILCPIHLLEALTPLHFDLVVNTGSMQEMTGDWITFWMGWLSRQNCRWFYSMNYFGQPLGDLMESGNMWSPRLNPDWIIRRQEFDPSFMRQQTERHYAELLAEKTPPGSQPTPEQIRLRYQISSHRLMDLQLLLEIMDIVRLGADVEIIWDALRRIVAEIHPVPKEAYHLVELLRQKDDVQFLGQHGTELAAIAAQFETIRAKGRENTHSP
jgi:putative sugar O-methyltransferase